MRAYYNDKRLKDLKLIDEKQGSEVSKIAIKKGSHGGFYNAPRDP